jgi:hypothetical protein
MIRTIVENILLFLLPTLAYVAWVLISQAWAKDTGKDGPKAASLLDDAPLLWLFAGGALLVIVTLAAFESSSSGGKPGQHYQPPSMKDGKIDPGHID